MSIYTPTVYTNDASSPDLDYTNMNKIENAVQKVSRESTPISDIARVMQITGDGVPAFPDNVAGRTYWHDKDWTATTGWSAPVNTVLSIENSKLKIEVPSGTGANNIYFMNSSFQSKLIRIIIKSDTKINNIYTVAGSGVYTQMNNLTSLGGGRYSADIFWSRTGADAFNIWPNYGESTAITWYLESIYIGSGLFDTPVYDRAGNYNLTNYGVLPVKGVRGQALSFNGARYLQADNPVIGTTGTIAFTIKRASIGTEQYIFSNSTMNASGFSLRFNSSNILRLSIFNGTGYGYGAQTITDVTAWHDIVVSFSASAIIIYIDGVVADNIASPQVMAPATAVLTIGQSGQAFNGMIANVRYDTKIWTQDDVTRYHNGDDAVDSQQKAINQVPHAIKICDAKGNIRQPGLPVYADNTAALAGGLVAGEQYRTSTGILMVVY